MSKDKDKAYWLARDHAHACRSLACCDVQAANWRRRIAELEARMATDNSPALGGMERNQ